MRVIALPGEVLTGFKAGVASLDGLLGWGQIGTNHHVGEGGVLYSRETTHDHPSFS